MFTFVALHLQAGFLELLFERFRWSVIVTMVYLGLTIALQAWILIMRWDKSLKYNWPAFLGLLYILQRSSKWNWWRLGMSELKINITSFRLKYLVLFELLTYENIGWQTWHLIVHPLALQLLHVGLRTWLQSVIRPSCM